MVWPSICFDSSCNTHMHRQTDRWTPQSNGIQRYALLTQSMSISGGSALPDTGGTEGQRDEGRREGGREGGEEDIVIDREDAFVMSLSTA